MLCPDTAGRYSLAEVLRGSHRSVWVDCRHISTLPTEALLLLRQCAGRLWQHGGHLVLCHLTAAASLLDAEQHGLACPEGTPAA